MKSLVSLWLRQWPHRRLCSKLYLINQNKFTNSKWPMSKSDFGRSEHLEISWNLGDEFVWDKASLVDVEVGMVSLGEASMSGVLGWGVWVREVGRGSFVGSTLAGTSLFGFGWDKLGRG